MASKTVRANVKMRLQAGGATPAPPVGSSLGQYGVQLMDFCKKFNAETASRKGETVPVKVVIYTDKTFDFVCKGVPVTELILKRAGIQKGATAPGTQKAGTISRASIEEIAKIKMVDMNAVDLEGAKKTVAGSARSMGLEVID